MEFRGKRVLVTGGTRGIGRAAVEAFLAAGARVAVNGRFEDTVEQACGELATLGQAVPAAGDVGTLAGCRRAVAAALEELGGLDVLVNNAGIAIEAGIAELEEADWDRVLSVNLKGSFFCIKFALPALRQARGNVVNVASSLGLLGAGLGTSSYCAAKGGLVNLSRDLALELAPEVRVNCLCPGVVRTAMIANLAARLGQGDAEAGYRALAGLAALRRLAEPREVADAVLYLASERASFVTGAIQLIDGGLSAR